jgi:S-formylglutathione hydrolase FrmB
VRRSGRRTGWSRRRLVVVLVAGVVVLGGLGIGLGLTLGASGSSPGQVYVPPSSNQHGKPLDLPRIVAFDSLGQIRAEVKKSGVLPSDGTMVIVGLPATTSHFDPRDAYVYLPPVWFGSPEPRLPVLMLLPGEPGSPSDWSEGGNADIISNDFARTHDGKAPIVAMPDPYGDGENDTECLNTSRFGNAETYLADDVPAALQKMFDANVGSGSLAVGGLSAGGTCSVVLSLTHSDEFRTFASFSGYATPTYLNDNVRQSIPILYGGSLDAFRAHDPMTLLRENHYPGMAGWFEVGTSDQIPLAATRELVPAARKAGIETCVLYVSGGHDFAVWSKALSDSYPWLVGRLGLTPPPKSVPATCQ